MTVRRAAVLRIGSHGPAAAPAVPDLVRAMRDPDVVVRHDAANALVRIGAASAKELGTALTDENGDTR